jgi:hypothetical protein
MAGCTQGGGGGGGDGLFGNNVRGEKWSILCLRSNVAQHEQQINALAESLKKVAGINPRAVRVEHTPTASTLYYGTYGKQYDAEKNVTMFPPVFTQDIKLIRSLALGNHRPFLYAAPELISRKNIGPPEWDLRRAPGDLSLQVAEFYNQGDFQQREEAAVAYCEMLRQEDIEAWYYHDESGKSFVCVGHFSPSADVRTPDGKRDYGPEVKQLIARKEELQYNLVNGYKVKSRVGPGEMRYTPSFLRPIPKEGEPQFEPTTEGP